MMQRKKGHPDTPGRGPWDSMLTLGFAAAVAGGLLLAAAPDFRGLEWLNRAVGEAFFGTAKAPGGAQALRRWLYAVQGSTMAAFGILGLGVARNAFRSREPWARNALAVALAVWFPLDTAASLAHGVAINAGLNLVIALVLVTPVVAAWKQFTGRWVVTGALTAEGDNFRVEERQRHGRLRVSSQGGAKR